MSSGGILDKSNEDNIEQQEHSFEASNNSFGLSVDTTSEIDFSTDDKLSINRDQIKTSKNDERDKCKMNLDKTMNMPTSQYMLSEKFTMVNGCIDFSSNNNLSGRKDME